MGAISYSLLIDGQAAPADLIAAVQRIDAEEHAELADILRIDLTVDVRPDGSGWTIVDDDLFPRLARLRLVVHLGGDVSEPLLEALVVETSVAFSSQPGESILSVVAIDPTVLMNLEEKVRPWPDMADGDIAATIFGEYGFDADVEATQPTRQQVDVTTMQRGTDIQFLRHLARRCGCECYVEPDPGSGAIVGHFHPPRLDAPPQGVLSSSMGADTNLTSFRARFEMLRPTTASASALDSDSLEDQQGEAEQFALSTLGGRPSLNGDRPRRVLLSQLALDDAAALQTYAQAAVDRAGWAVAAEGELDTAVFGKLLRAKRPVEVRGVGRQFSGRYYVERVRHSFTPDGYTQRFTLRRNAIGLGGNESFTEDDALAS